MLANKGIGRGQTAISFRSLTTPYVHFVIDGLVEGILDLADLTVQRSLGSDVGAYGKYLRAAIVS